MINNIKAMQTYLSLIRKAAGLTSEELGSRIGVTRQTVNNIESGRSIMTKTQYCAVCHVLSEEFYNSDDDGLMFKLLYELLVVHCNQIDDKDAVALSKSAQIMVPAIISKEASRKDVSDAWINDNIDVLIKYHDLIADSFRATFIECMKYQLQIKKNYKLFSEACINSSADSENKNSIIMEFSDSLKDIIQRFDTELDPSILKSLEFIYSEHKDSSCELNNECLKKNH